MIKNEALPKNQSEAKLDHMQIRAGNLPVTPALGKPVDPQIPFFHLSLQISDLPILLVDTA